MNINNLENTILFVKSTKPFTKNDLFKIIKLTNKNKNDFYMKSCFYELLKNNIIYKFNSTIYKYAFPLIPFLININDELIKLGLIFKYAFPSIKVCIWKNDIVTIDNSIQNNITFIEVENKNIKVVYDCINRLYDNVYLESDDTKLNDSSVDIIVIRRLVHKSPIEKITYSIDECLPTQILSNTNIFSPTIEKIIIDMFMNKKTYYINYDYNTLLIKLLKTYIINFQKLFFYASNRGIKQKLENFLLNEIKYDFNTGFFLN